MKSVVLYKVLFSSLLTIMLLGGRVSFANSLSNDSLVLVKLYNNTNGNEWHYNEGWLTGPLSTWYGVEIGEGRIIALRLRENNLIGQLPISIGDLSFLKKLDLYKNLLSGSIPSSIGNLSLLQDLNLGMNDLSGSIPSEVGNLSSLWWLWLGDNNLTGTIPNSISNLTQLQILSLSDNQLTGDITYTVGALQSSTLLFLDHNEFQGTIGNELNTLSQLEALEVQDNNFDSLSSLSLLNLVDLNISSNSLTFNDLVPNANIASNKFIYAPQDSIDNTMSIEVEEGINQELLASIDIGVEGIEYRWYHNGDSIPGNGTHKHLLLSPDYDDMGVYHYTVSNDVLPELNLVSRKVNTALKEVNYPWEFDKTLEAHHIIEVSPSLISDIYGMPIEDGDFIGFFYSDDDGESIPGGALQWFEGKSKSITLWGRGEEGIKNGFEANEEFRIKVWKQADSSVFTVDGSNYNLEILDKREGYFFDQGISELMYISTTPINGCVTQIIDLKQGWNLISINVVPEDLSMSNIFEGLGNVIVKNSIGEVKYAPEYGLNSGFWSLKEGYMVFSTEDVVLEVCGVPIPLLTSITIPENTTSYFLPYFGQKKHSIKEILKNIEHRIDYAYSLERSDETEAPLALFYVPSHLVDPAVDQIAFMKPGKAYKLALNNSFSSYAFPLKINAEKDEINDEDLVDVHDPQYYKMDESSYFEDNALLIIEKDALEYEVEEGDEVGVFTQSGTLAGAAVISDEHIIAPVWNIEGTEVGFPYLLKIWDESAYMEKTFEPVYSKGDGKYSPHSADVISMVMDIQIVDPVTTSLITQKAGDDFSFGPNPTNGNVLLKINSEKNSNFRLTIYSLEGIRLWEEGVNGYLGQIEHEYNLSFLSSGLYYYIVETDFNRYKGKILITR